jgi:hypothetical protein
MLGSKAMPKVGMVLGIAIIGGSVVGGFALTMATPAPASETGSTVPLGDQAEPNATSATESVDSTVGATRPAGSPSQLPHPSPTATTTPASTPTLAPTSMPTSRPTATPTRNATPTPTCWPEGMGEHPPGIEDCH